MLIYKSHELSSLTFVLISITSVPHSSIALHMPSFGWGNIILNIKLRAERNIEYYIFNVEC